MGKRVTESSESAFKRNNEGELEAGSPSRDLSGTPSQAKPQVTVGRKATGPSLTEGGQPGRLLQSHTMGNHGPESYGSEIVLGQPGRLKRIHQHFSL
jgi:hypothetical protein